MHTHDTPGTGVASMLAAAAAGADVVDVAIDAMSGLTSQPSMGAIASVLRGTELDTGIDAKQMGTLNTYWENVRDLYLPFKSGQLSGSSDVCEYWRRNGSMPHTSISDPVFCSFYDSPR